MMAILSAGQKILTLDDDVEVTEQVASAPAGWWLSGGMATGNCLGAYDAKNAASLAASYINLNSPGTHDLTVGVEPAWTAGIGWINNGTKYLITDIQMLASYSIVARFSWS